MKVVLRQLAVGPGATIKWCYDAWVSGRPGWQRRSVARRPAHNGDL